MNIWHSWNRAQRRRYAIWLRTVAVSYYENQSWTPLTADATAVLMEVWEQPGEVNIHKSRNQFRWVQGPQKGVLHSLVTTNMSVFQSSTAARAARAGILNQQPQPIPNPKDLRAPPWANAANVIGYTSSKHIAFVPDGLGIPIQDLNNLDSFPSIYYKGGHATIDHQTKGNIGWEYGTGWTCLFFGNVPEWRLRAGAWTP